jgi:CTP-dependent riboflavin kinase
MQLAGAVSSGLGRAHIFMSQQHYQEQFKKILGATAWPGTLNVEVDGADLANYIALRTICGLDTPEVDESAKAEAAKIDSTAIISHRVRGFHREGRSFGGATAFLAEISTADGEEPLSCAILIPDLTRHVDVVEVIATYFLRETLGIVDGDTVDLILTE